MAAVLRESIFKVCVCVHTYSVCVHKVRWKVTEKLVPLLLDQKTWWLRWQIRDSLIRNDSDAASRNLCRSPPPCRYSPSHQVSVDAKRSPTPHPSWSAAAAPLSSRQRWEGNRAAVFILACALQVRPSFTPAAFLFASPPQCLSVDYTCTLPSCCSLVFLLNKHLWETLCGPTAKTASSPVKKHL